MSYTKTFSEAQHAKIEAVDKFIVDKLHPKDEALDATLAANSAADLMEIDVSPPHGKFLYLLAKMNNAKRILEFGTLGGYSAVWFGKAIPEDGKVITCEIDPHHAEVAKKNIENAGLGGKVDIRLGPALETLAKLEKEGVEDFDMVFIDADKENNAAYFKWALEHSHSGTLIVVDNVVRRGWIVEPGNKEPSTIGTLKLFETLKQEKRVECTALQTVGSKGWDGMALARVL